MEISFEASFENQLRHMQHLNRELELRNGLQVELNLVRSFGDSTHDWVTWMDPEGRNFYVSPSCERMTGYFTAEFLNDPGLLETITHPQDRELVTHHVRADRGGFDGGAMDFRIITRSGEERWISHVCEPVFDRQGVYLGRTASHRDITERKREAEMQSALIAELKTSLAKVKALNSALLPICAACKKVRDEDGYWHEIEVFIRDHTSAEFSHGLCPCCVEHLYPEICDEQVAAVE